MHRTTHIVVRFAVGIVHIVRDTGCAVRTALIGVQAALRTIHIVVHPALRTTGGVARAARRASGPRVANEFLLDRLEQLEIEGANLVHLSKDITYTTRDKDQPVRRQSSTRDPSDTM